MDLLQSTLGPSRAKDKAQKGKVKVSLTKVTQAKVEGTNSNGARHDKHKRHQHGNNDMQAAKATKAKKNTRPMKVELAKLKRTKATKAKVKETTPIRASSATFANNMVRLPLEGLGGARGART